MYTVLLYYKFSPINDPKSFCVDHKVFCEEQKLTGRVYISDEGINGTIAGRNQNIETYKKSIRSMIGFEDIQFKEEPCEYTPFEKLVVKVRPEIVALKVDEPLNVAQEGDGHLTPQEWRKMIESDEDYVLIDVRNNYESAIGHFKGAICPDVKNFYEFPDWLDKENIPTDKKVLMYCTGGIRCEKFSIYMKRKGYEDVKQLYGGIINYGKEEGGEHFKGKCFVFDDRLEVEVNKKETEPLTVCEVTGKPWDKYINCANMDCNKLFLCSPEGAEQTQGCCSKECMESVHRRPFDAATLYQPFRKWYKYFEEKA